MQIDIGSPDRRQPPADRGAGADAKASVEPIVVAGVRTTDFQSASRPASNRMAALGLLMFAIAAGVLFPLTAMLAATQDGDGVLTALMSVDKLTWYFWGQDRFLNVIPALASAIADIEWNLRFQVFLRSFFAYLAPLGVLVFINKSPRFLLAAVVIANALLIATLDQEALFNLYVQHNPFGTSMVLFAGAWLSHRALQRHPWTVALTFLLCAIAYAVNLALLIYSAPLIVYLLVTRAPDRRTLFLFGVINAFAVMLAFVHARIFGEKATSFVITPSFDALSRGLAAIHDHVNVTVVASIAVVALMVIRMHRMTCKKEVLALAGISLGMAVLLANLGWVQQNLFNIRYFLLAVVVLATAFAIIIASALVDTKIATPVVLAGLLPVFAACTTVGLHGLSDSYTDLIHPKWARNSAAIATIVNDDDVRIIIGDFWDVWPAVYASSASRYRSGRNQTRVYGAAFRGHPLRERFLVDTVDQGEQTALCFLADEAECVAHLRTWLGLPGNIEIAVDGAQAVVAGAKQLVQFRFSVALAQ